MHNKTKNNLNTYLDDFNTIKKQKIKNKKKSITSIILTGIFIIMLSLVIIFIGKQYGYLFPGLMGLWIVFEVFDGIFSKSTSNEAPPILVFLAVGFLPIIAFFGVSIFMQQYEWWRLAEGFILIFYIFLFYIESFGEDK